MDRTLLILTAGRRQFKAHRPPASVSIGNIRIALIAVHEEIPSPGAVTVTERVIVVAGED